MTTIEQPTQSRVRSVGASTRSDTPSTMKTSEHDTRAKSRRHHRSVARHGAQLSKAYRHIGYQVIASSRSMRESDDPAILVIEGDIIRPETAERILGIAAE